MDYEPRMMDDWTILTISGARYAVHGARFAAFD
jgi:hypothetical protein